MGRPPFSRWRVRRRRRIPDATWARGDYRPESGRWSTVMLSALETERSPAGVRVSGADALRLSAVFACVRAVSDTLTTLPLHVFEAQDFHGRFVERRIWKHPLAQLLSNPNPELSDVEFWEHLVWCLELRGNAYAEIVRDRFDQPVALWPLDPLQTSAKRIDGIVYYDVRKPSGDRIRLAGHNVLHVRSWAMDGLTGMSPIRYAAYSVGQGLAGLEWGSRLFKGSGLQRIALVSETPLRNAEAADELRDRWDRAYGGLSNSDRTAILSGVKPQVIGISPKDAQLLELIQASEEAVCRIFHVPPHKAGFLGKASYNNVEQMQLDWKTDSILPRAVRIERALWRALFGGAAELRPRYNLDGVARATLKERNEANSLSLINGVKTPNECREEDGLEPYEGGDVHFRPLNLLAVNPDGSIIGALASDTGAGTDSAAGAVASKATFVGRETRGPDAKPRMTRNLELRSAWRGAVEDAYGRLVRRTFRDGIEAAIKARSRRDGDVFEGWLSGYLDGLPGVAEKILGPSLSGFGAQVVREALASIGADGLDGESGYLDQYVGGAAEKYSGWYAEQISAIQHKYGIEYTTDMIREEVAKWEAKHVAGLANRDLVYGDGNLSRAAWQANGIQLIRWVAGGEACPICQEIDGHVVGIEKSWGDAGTGSAAWDAAGFAPASSIAHPPLHVGCDCSIVAEGS